MCEESWPYLWCSPGKRCGPWSVILILLFVSPALTRYKLQHVFGRVVRVLLECWYPARSHRSWIVRCRMSHHSDAGRDRLEGRKLTRKAKARAMNELEAPNPVNSAELMSKTRQVGVDIHSSPPVC